MWVPGALRTAGLLCLALIALPAVAELSGEDYRSETVIQDEAERARVRDLIEAARQREAERAQERERQAAERARAQAEAEARRPPGERAVAAHCSQCHTVESVLAASHTRVGWHFTVWRMRVWNGADLPPGTASLIAEHLAALRPARGGRRIMEYGAMLVCMLLLAQGVWWLRRRQRR